MDGYATEQGLLGNLGTGSSVWMVMLQSRGAVLNCNKGDCVVGNMWTTPLTTPIFCMYGKNVLVKLVYVKVLQEGESESRIVAFFFY